jgi:hypothetical protein
MKPFFKKSPKAFVLIVALLLAVATAAVAVSLQQGSGSAIVAVTHSNAGEQARALAEIGLARAESYAMTVSRAQQDFDKVLDPNNQADCSNLDLVTDSGLVPETGDMYLPLWTDTGVTTTTFEGLRWKVIPFNGGAYMVRYSDNFDDGVVADATVATIDWTGSTSNNRSGTAGQSTFCVEGPKAPNAAGTPGTNGVNNPARDRDRTIIASVIGIYPGTNPTTAKHRSALSRVIFDGRVRGPTGLKVGGTVDIANGAAMQFCSEVSGMSASGIIDSGPPQITCACGTVQAPSVDIQEGQCTSCCGSNEFIEVDGAAPAAPVVPAVRNKAWYDYTSYCNFHMDQSTSAFYYWDAEGTRAGTACSTYAGDLPDPDLTGATFPGACWVPLWKNTAGVFTVPLGLHTGANQEVVKGGGCDVAGGTDCIMEWQPRNVNIPSTNVGSTGTIPGYTGVATINVRKPNWQTECPKSSALSDFRWSPPQPDTGSGEEVACSTCDGTRGVLRVTEGAQYQILDNPRAAPVGVYFHRGNLAANFDQTVPTAQQTLAANAWPMMTLIVDGNITTANASDIVLGVGTRKKDYASLVVGGNLTTNNATQVAFAGSIYVRGNVTFDHGNAGGSTMFGRVEVQGDLRTAAGSRVNWDYDTELFDNTAIRQAARVKLSTPIGF